MLLGYFIYDEQSISFKDLKFPAKQNILILLMLTGRFLSCLVFCIFAFLLLLVEYFEYLIELQIFAGIVVGMFVVILCCSKFFYDLQVTTSKCTALHTTVGPHLCCDNWKGQRLRDFYSVYWANEVFYI